MAQFIGKKNTFLVRQSEKFFIRTFALVLGAVVILAVIAVISFIYRRNHQISYSLLLISIIILVIYKIVLKKWGNNSFSYIKGLRGEQDVAAALLQLPESFTIFSDISIKNMQGNIDYVVVGPTGIFTIEVKNISGQITYNNELLIDGKPFKKNYIKQAMDEALFLHNHLLISHSLDVFIVPILVFSNRFAGVRFGMKKVENVSIVGIGWLNKTITESSMYNFDQEKVKVALEKLSGR